MNRNASRLLLLSFFFLVINLFFAQSISTFKHDTFPPIPYSKSRYDLKEQRQLSWLLQDNCLVSSISIYTYRCKFPNGTSYKHNKINEYTIDSVRYIPDSIITLQQLSELEINGSDLQYISPSLSQLPKLKTLEVNAMGKSIFTTAIPVLPSIKEALIYISDSISAANILKSCPNVKNMEIQMENYKHWNFYDMLYCNPKLKRLTIPWWEGNAPESNRKYSLLGDENVGYDTMGVHYKYLDINLSHCKHLRRIETDYTLSPEMRRYCRKHFIQVVPSSKTSFMTKLKRKIKKCYNKNIAANRPKNRTSEKGRYAAI